MPTITHHHGRYLSLLERDGWEYASRESSNGVAVLIPVTPDDEIVLVEQYRIPVEAPVIELPAGLVGDGSDANEDLIDAAGRELEEETGFRAGRLESILTGPTSAGLSDELVTFVLARDLERVGPGGGIDDEEITVHVVPLIEVDRWLKNRLAAGQWIEPKVFTGLHLLRMFG